MKFELFKKVLPAATLLAGLDANAQLIETTCMSADRQFGLKYTNVDFTEGDTYSNFNFFRVDNYDYFGGNGSMSGRGRVGKTSFSMNLVWTRTGSHNENKIGRLEGKLNANSEWDLMFVPWDPDSGKYLTNEKVALNRCSSAEI